MRSFTILGLMGLVLGLAVAIAALRNAARWKAVLPGAANYESFSVVGHCLFALLAGLLGMVIARRYEARQERDLETGPVTEE